MVWKQQTRDEHNGREVVAKRELNQNCRCLESLAQASVEEKRANSKQKQKFVNQKVYRTSKQYSEFSARLKDEYCMHSRGAPGIRKLGFVFQRPFVWR